MRLPSLLICAFAATSAALATPYQYQELPMPTGMKDNVLVAVSHQGTYFLTQATALNGTTHFLIYGPNSTTRYQDLSGSAGPYGPNTGGILWPGQFNLVNDKGITTTTNPQLANIYDVPYALYNKENHALTPLQGCEVAEAINDRNAVAGSYDAPASPPDQVYQPIARWDTQNGTLKFVDPDVSFPFGPRPGNYVDSPNYDAQTAFLSDTDMQVGSAGGADASGNSSGNFGFAYLVGPTKALTFGYPSNAFVQILGMNNSNLVTGTLSYNGQSQAFVGDLNGNLVSLLANPVNEGNTAFDTQSIGMDSANDVLGLDDNASVYYLWSGATGIPTSLSDLCGVTIPPQSSFEIGVYNEIMNYITVDLTGRVFGTWQYQDEPSGDVTHHTFILTPSST